MQSGTSIVTAILTFIFFSIGVYIGYEKLVKKGWVKEKIHPYTQKRDKLSFFDFFRHIVLLFLILAAFYYSPRSGILLLVVSVVVVYSYISKNKKESEEKNLANIEYSKEEIKRWKEKFKEKTKNGIAFSKTTKKLVVTEKHIYFSKQFKLPIQKKAWDNFVFQKMEEKTDFVVAKYIFAGLIPVSFFIYIPSDKKKEAKKILNIKVN